MPQLVASVFAFYDDRHGDDDYEDENGVCTALSEARLESHGRGADAGSESQNISRTASGEN